MLSFRRPLGWALLFLAGSIAPVHGQTPPVQAEPAAALTLSFAPLKEVFGGSGFMASAQFPVTAHVYVEGAFTHRWQDRFGFQQLGISTAGANLIFRAGSPRWGGFLGGGLGVERSRLDQQPFSVVLPSQFVSSVRYGLAGIVLGGAEVTLTSRLSAFGDVRMRSDLRDASRVGIAGGLRAALSTRRPTQEKPVVVGSRAAPPGTEVRVTLRDGVKRSGRLVALTASDVAIVEQGTAVTLALERVQRVERVAHHARTGTLIGAAWTGFMWITVAATRDSCGDCDDGPAFAAMMTPVALGAGAGIGAFINAATRNRHVLYQGPQPGPVVDVTPSLAPDRAALMVNVKW